MVRDCSPQFTPTVGGRIFVDISSYTLTSTDNEWRANLYWAFTDVPDGTEIVVRVGRTLPNLDCFPEVATVPRIHVLVEGGDAETVRAAVIQFRSALALWAERTAIERTERQKREAWEAADRAWWDQRWAVSR